MKIVGLDVGSTTVEALADDGGAPVWQDYRRHDTRQAEMALHFLLRMEAECGLEPGRDKLFLTGIPASLGFGLWSDISWRGRSILESTDYLVSNVLLPSGGVLTALLVGSRWSAPALEETVLKGRRIGRVSIASLRYVIPPLIVAIFLRALGLI